MKILVTGSGGQVGKSIINAICKKELYIGRIEEMSKKLDIISLDKGELDICNELQVKKIIEIIHPDIVINCAAYTDVDGCEKNIEKAFKVNAEGAKNLAKGCNNISAKLIHMSTDYVFDGEKQTPYSETDEVNPINIYGKSKAKGELYVREFCRKHFIIRSSWIYSSEGNNFVKNIIDIAKKQGCINVVNDQVGSPTNAEDLVYHLIRISMTNKYGIYHCTGKGQCSWYEFASDIIKTLGINCKVNPCTSQEFPRLAKRPKYSVMDSLMLEDVVGNHMRHWKDALIWFLDNLNNL